MEYIDIQFWGEEGGSSRVHLSSFWKRNSTFLWGNWFLSYFPSPSLWWMVFGPMLQTWAADPDGANLYSVL